MMTRARFLIVGAVALLSLAACAATTAPAPAASVDRIVSTTSFGMCVGYCRTRLEIAEGQAVLIREPGGRGGSGNRPTQRFTATLTASEWEEISRLAASTDLSGLPDVIGCPDCADGGAELLSITRGGAERTVTFDYGASIAPAQALLERVRAVRARLMPQE